MIHGACGHIHLHLGSKAHYCSNRNTVLAGTMNKSIDTKSKGSARYETVWNTTYTTYPIPHSPSGTIHYYTYSSTTSTIDCRPLWNLLSVCVLEDTSRTKTQRVFAARVFFRHPDAELGLSMYYTSSYQNHHQSQSLPRSQGDNLLVPTIHFPPKDPPQTSLLRGGCRLPAFEWCE